MARRARVREDKGGRPLDLPFAGTGRALRAGPSGTREGVGGEDDLDTFQGAGVVGGFRVRGVLETGGSCPVHTKDRTRRRPFAPSRSLPRTGKGRFPARCTLVC